jgi:NADH-quinone oxidoreductase subunit N
MLNASTSELFATSDLRLIAPELVLSICACVALVIEVILPSTKSRIVGYFSLGSLVLTFITVLVLFGQLSGAYNILHPPDPVFSVDGFYGTVRVDRFSIIFKCIFLIAAALTIAISLKYLDIEREQRGEYYALILFATIGMMFMASGYDLIILYISLELMAVTFYVLVAFNRREKRSNEAAMKYFLLGAFSSGILLYGMSVLFGVAGSTNLGEIQTAVGQVFASIQEGTEAALPATFLRVLLILGMVSLAAGLFFKVSAVPFHMWAPDAYEGAPTPVTAFLSTGSKAASFALFARIFSEALWDMRIEWAPLLGLVAAITIFVGNVGAITQLNSKRLLAYSSISNAGYLLLGLIAANGYGYTGLIVYLFVYTFMNIGAFGIIITLRRKGYMGDHVDDFSGLAQKSPLMAFFMTVFMLSLGGLPVTGGFIGKYFLFGGILQRGVEDGRNWYIVLAIWAILNTVISFYYYVRFIRVMYLTERSGVEEPVSLTPALRFTLAIAVIAVIFIGIYPQPLISIAETVARSIFESTGNLALK